MEGVDASQEDGLRGPRVVDVGGITLLFEILLPKNTPMFFRIG